jgi:hypothetical protein
MLPYQNLEMGLAPTKNETSAEVNQFNLMMLLFTPEFVASHLRDCQQKILSNSFFLDLEPN